MDQLPTMTDEEFSQMLGGKDPADNRPEPILVHFNFTHLEGANRAVTKAYAELAAITLVYGDRGPERSTALRKLIEGLDATRRAMPKESAS